MLQRKEIFMKKYFAIVMAAITVAACFTACNKYDGGVVTDAASKDYAVVTNEDGGIVRDEAGNIILNVTDADGNVVKDENGETQTQRVNIDTAIVVGNRIDCKTFSLVIPDGWSNNMSYTDLIITRDGTEDQIKIMVAEGAKLDDVMAQKMTVLNLAKSNHPGAENATKEIKIGEAAAQYSYVYVADTGVREEQEDGSLKVISTYVGFIFLQHRDDVYTCMLSSDKNMNEQIDEITGILNTIEFI